MDQDSRSIDGCIIDGNINSNWLVIFIYGYLRQPPTKKGCLWSSNFVCLNLYVDQNFVFNSNATVEMKLTMKYVIIKIELQNLMKRMSAEIKYATTEIKLQNLNESCECRNEIYNDRNKIIELKCLNLCTDQDFCVPKTPCERVQ